MTLWERCGVGPADHRRGGRWTTGTCRHSIVWCVLASWAVTILRAQTSVVRSGTARTTTGSRTGTSRTLILLLAAACDGGVGLDSNTPVVLSFTVAGNPNNVLSALAVVRVKSADSVVVHYRLTTDAGDSVTAAMAVVGDSALVPVLGLLPERSYRIRVVAYGAGGTAESEIREFQTGALPADLPRYTASGPDPAAGYVVFAAGRYGLAIDNTGARGLVPPVPRRSGAELHGAA